MTATRPRFLAALGAVGAAGVVRGRAAAQTPLHVRIGAAPVEPQAQVFYALDNGFFTKNGLTADLLPMRSGSVTIEALLAGQIDIGIANVISFGSALLKGLPLVAIAPGVFNDASDHNFAIVVPAGSAVTKASDLNGKTVGVTSLGSLDGLTFLAFLGKNGGDPKSLKIVEVAQAAMVDTMQQGRIAAGVVYDPELSVAVTAGRVRVIPGGLEAVASRYLATTWFTTRTFLGSSKDVVRRSAAALIAGGAWAEANRAASLAILEKYTKIHEDKSDSHYGRRLDPAQLQVVWDAATAYGVYPAPIKATDVCWDGK